MAYVKQTWTDRPSKTTPINAARLNHMEEGIYDTSKNFNENGINFGRKADTTSGMRSTAEGFNTTASDTYAHAEGYQSVASGTSSHAEGYQTNATGSNSHSEGEETVASGYDSHAEGRGTIAKGEYQHVQGKYNIEDTKNQYAHIVGGGVDETGRKNIHTIDWNGNAVFAGDVTNGEGITMNGLKSLIDALQVEVNALKTS